MKKQEKRYPFSEKILHNAGQSLDEQLTEIRVAKLITVLLFAVILIELMGDWFSWYRQSVIDPLPGAIFDGIIGIGVIYFNYRLNKKATRIKLGKDGEKIAAQNLDNLKTLGCSVYHDAVAHDQKYKFNIDHIVVSTRGIFAIETKAFSKPLKGQPKAYYDGKKILRSGGEFDSRSIDEAKFHAKWLEDQIFVSTGKRFPVMPVVAYTEWLVDEVIGKNFWFLNPKRVAANLEKQPVIMNESDMILITSRLGQIPDLAI